MRELKHAGKDITLLLRKAIVQFDFVLLDNDCVQSKYFPDNNLQVYSSHVLAELTRI